MTALPNRAAAAGAALLLAALAAAAVPAFSARGKLLFNEDFSAASLAPGWTGKPGTWVIVSGAARVSERPEDKHAAVRRHALAYHDAVFEFSFQFNGARMIGLSLNNKGGHVCRLTVTPAGMVLQTDRPTAKSDLKTVKLAELKRAVEPGKWHKVVVEVRGPRMLAQMDGGPVIAGESPLVDVDKIDFGIPVGGVSALVNDVRVYAIAAN